MSAVTLFLAQISRILVGGPSRLLLGFGVLKPYKPYSLKTLNPKPERSRKPRQPEALKTQASDPEKSKRKAKDWLSGLVFRAFSVYVCVCVFFLRGGFGVLVFWSLKVQSGEGLSRHAASCTQPPEPG